MNIYIVLIALNAIALMLSGIMIGYYIEKKYFSTPVIENLKETNEEALKILEAQHRCLQHLHNHIIRQLHSYRNPQAPVSKHLN